MPKIRISPVWAHFEQVEGNVYRCKKCEYTSDITAKQSTTTLLFHLKSKHKEAYKKIEDDKLREIKKTTAAIQKKAAQAKIFFKPSVPPTPCTDEQSSPSSTAAPVVSAAQGASQSFLHGKQPTLKEVLTMWHPESDKSKAVDRIITEMIAVDGAPFNVVERAGFKRLIQFLVPRYHLRGRRYYAYNELEALFQELTARVKKDVSRAKYLSFTTDIWSAKDSSHMLLSLTAHFVDDSMQPHFLVLAATPMKMRHTSVNIKDLLEKNLQKFGIESSRVHMILRDAANAMNHATELLGEDSFDCFVHKLHLVVGDGLKSVNGLDDLVERVKRLIRRLRKSHVEKEAFQKLQEELDMPENVLIKEVKVRWSSMFAMLDRLLANIQVVQLYLASTIWKADQVPIEFSDADIALMRAIRSILRPFNDFSKKLQDRRTSIAFVIPTYVVLLNKLEKPSTEKGVFDLPDMRQAMWDGLGSRMSKWAEDNNLVLATILDPRYKMSYFTHLPQETQDRYRLSLSMEVEALVEAAASDAVVASYFADWGAGKPKPQPQPRSSIEARHKAEIIVKRYLKEARIGPDDDPYEYWAAKDDENWSELKLLVQRFHCAPAGSVESERLFSTAGFIVNDLRKKLLVENLEKLLFCHHNLPIYDFKYQE